MAQVHQLVLLHGRSAARRMVPDDQVHLVDLAASMLEEETQGIGITYSGFCLTSMPHRRLPDDQKWSRSSPTGRVSLLIEPGQVRTRPATGDADFTPIGVPYGPKARLILLYLQTRAIQENSPEVELGRSMNAWLDRMGISAGGKTYAEVRTQAERISRCRLTFFWEDARGREGFENTSIVSSGIRLSQDNRQGSLWSDTVRLSDAFFRALRDHPVPVWEPAVRQLLSRSMAFDVYVWLAYRLHVLTKATPVSRPALFGQFGGGYKAERQFWPEFRKSLDLALAVYPDATVTLDDAGVTLHPSRPPVPERDVGRLGR